ncbi:MAG: ATPase domain-containing protein [Thermoplasmata archaeon]
MRNSETRVMTGIAGLDALAQGGFPKNSVNLVSGPAGSGKTLLATQFFFNGAKDNGDTGLYLVLEENRENIIRAMKNFQMDLGELENQGRLFLIDLGEIRTDQSHGVVGFREIMDFLESFIDRTRPKRLVLDSLPVVGLYYRNVDEFREELFTFSRYLRQRDLTSLLISESLENQGLTRFGVEQFVADSFIVLGLEEVRGELRRTITVRKMRFTKHDTAKHPFLITPRGIEVMSEEKVV